MVITLLGSKTGSIAAQVIIAKQGDTGMLIHIEIETKVLNTHSRTQGDRIIFFHLSEDDLTVFIVEKLPLAFGQAFKKVVIAFFVLDGIRHGSLIPWVDLHVHWRPILVFTTIDIELSRMVRRSSQDIGDIV